MKTKVCPTLPSIPVVGPWYRALKLRYLQTALKTSHSATVPSRFSEGDGSCELLYLGEDFETILYEVQAQLGTPHGINTSARSADNNWASIQVVVQLSAVVDLCDKTIQGKLGTTSQELTGNWDGYRIRGDGAAPTQVLGRALFECGGIEGFISYSARSPSKKVLVVFPERLSGGSFVNLEYDDGKRSVSHRIP